MSVTTRASGVLLLVAIGTWGQRAHAAAPWWNADWTHRAALDISEQSGQAGRNCPAAVRDFQLLRTIITGSPTVVDDLGKPVTTVLAEYANGSQWLWFGVRRLPAKGRVRYHLYWGGKSVPKAAVKIAPGAAGDQDDPDEGDDLFEDIAGAADFTEGTLPPELAGLADGSLDPPPRVEVGPPEGPPWWLVVDGAYRQDRPDRNVMAFAGPAMWRDYELTVRLKPDGASLAGVLFRVADRRYDAKRYYWLASVTKDGRQGSSNVWCGYRHHDRGDTLIARQWNTVKVRCERDQFRLFLNGKLQKEFEDDDAPLLSGGIGLATFGGAAWFDDVRVTSIPDGRLLFSDDFRDGDDGGWESFAHRMGPAFVSIVNKLDVPAFYYTPVNFHHDPWKWKSLYVSKLGLTERQPTQEHWLAPGERSPWAPLGERMSRRSHSTLTISARTSRFGSSPIRARIDIAPQPSLKHVARSFDYTSDTPNFIAEFHPIELALTPNFFTSEEIAEQTLATVRSFPERGRRPKKFRVGGSGYPSRASEKTVEAELDVGVALGFNVVGTHIEGIRSREDFTSRGYVGVSTYTHLMSMPQYGHGFRHDLIEREIKRLADVARKKNVIDLVESISLFDEPGFGLMDQLSKDADCAADPSAWTDMITTAGYTVEEFVDKSELPPGQKLTEENKWHYVFLGNAADAWYNPELFYKTAHIMTNIYATRFRNITTKVKKHFPPTARTTCNPNSPRVIRGVQSDLDMVGLYRVEDAQGLASCADYTWVYSNGGPQQVAWLTSILRSGAKYRNLPVGLLCCCQVSYIPASDRYLRLRLYSAVASGATRVSFFSYGPRWGATENWYSTSAGRLRVLHDFCHEVGFAEDHLCDGELTPAQVGLLFSHSTDIWDAVQGGSAYTSERRIMYLMLRHCQVPVDILAEEDLDLGYLDRGRYKILFMAQDHLPAAGAAKLIEWVRAGGTLVSCAGGGFLTPYQEQNHGLRELYGVKSQELDKTWPREPDPREVIKIDCPAMPKPVEIPVRGFLQRIGPDAATVWARFRDGSSAIVCNSFGRGRSILIGALPAHTYFRGIKTKNDVPTNMDERPKEFFRALLDLANVTRDVVTSDDLVEARVIRSKTGFALPLANYSSEPIEQLTVRVIEPRKLRRLESVEAGRIDYRRKGEWIEFGVPIELVHMIVGSY